MTDDRDFKRLVRQRMAEMGEQYTQSREALRPTAPSPDAGRDDTTRPPGPHSEPAGAAPSPSVRAYLGVDPDLSSDDLVMLAAARMSADRFASLRSVLPDETVEEVIGAAMVGVTAETAAAWRHVDPAISVDQIMGSVTVGLTPQRLADFRRSKPDASVEDVWQWETMGLAP